MRGEIENLSSLLKIYFKWSNHRVLKLHTCSHCAMVSRVATVAENTGRNGCHQSDTFWRQSVFLLSLQTFCLPWALQFWAAVLVLFLLLVTETVWAYALMTHTLCIGQTVRHTLSLSPLHSASAEGVAVRVGHGGAFVLALPAHQGSVWVTESVSLCWFVPSKWLQRPECLRWTTGWALRLLI